MKQRTFWIALPLLALAGCSVQTRPRPSQASGPGPQAQPGGTAPAHHGGAAPRPMLGRGSPTPGGAAMPPPVVRPVNVSALRALRGRPCAPREVAPGTWVSFDCGQHQPVTRAMAFVPRHNFITGSLPEQVDHRASGFTGPVKNQGAVGSCTAVSLSSAMDNAVRRMGRQEVVSPLHIWSQYAVPMMGQAGDRTVDRTITVEQTWPYDPLKACKLNRFPQDSCGAAYNVQPGSGEWDPVLKGEKSKADGAGQFKLIAVEQIKTEPVNIQEVTSVLAAGDSLWVSFWVSDAWMNGSMQNGVIPDYHQREDVGHAVVLTGYRTVGATRQYMIQNSWGEKWGQGGYGWISEAMVQKHLRSAYRVRIADSQGGGIPVPPGGPTAPNASGCPDGQVRDAVMATCAPLCPSGSPPAAGVCLPAIPGFPAPGGPGPSPQPAPQGNCPQGQSPDLMTGQCTNLCPGNLPAVGGMCLPGMR